MASFLERSVAGAIRAVGSTLENPNLDVRWLQQAVEDLQATVGRLQESSDLYRIVADTASDVILSINEAGIIQYANPSASTLLDYAPDELMGKSIKHIMPDFLRDAHDKSFHRFLETGQKTISWRGIEVQVVHKSGELIPVEVSFGMIQTPEGNYRFTGFLRDIRERKEFEEESRKRLAELEHANRVKTVGELASGLAHELNQPLSAVCLQADAAQEIIKNSPIAQAHPEVVELLEDVSVQSIRASQIVKHLRSLVSKGESKREVVDIATPLTSALQISSARMRSTQIQMNCHFTPRLPSVVIDQIQVEQVILNLLNNAIDAIESSDSDHREIALTTRYDPEVKSLLITVMDTGIGIDEHELGRIFDSFYTTKSDGMGMGLGICQSIIHAHKGTIGVTSTLGVGTEFTISLPIGQTEDN